MAVHAKTRWQVLAVRAMIVRQLAYRSHHSVICQGTVPDLLQARMKEPSRSIISRIWRTGSHLKDFILFQIKYVQNLENQLLHRWMCYCTVALRRAIF
jgi:hypothetical protein